MINFNEISTNVLLFKKISKSFLKNILNKCKIKFLNENEMLFHQNDKSESLYIILNGEINLFINNQFITKRGKYEIIGEQGVFENKPRSTDAVANTFTQVLIIKKDLFFDMLSKEPNIALNLIKILSIKLRQASLTRAEIFKREKLIRNYFKKKMSPEVYNLVMEEINERIPTFDTIFEFLPIKKKEGVIMFTDIRNFTSLCEKTTLTKLQEGINKYFSKMNEIIDKFNGNIDKFIGDGILIYFFQDKNVCDLSITCAEEMIEYVATHNFGFRNKFKIGIGLHYGDFLFGDFGSNIKLETTIIGDTVNIASRLQDITKKYKTSLIISQMVYDKLSLPNKNKFISLGKAELRNRQLKINIYKYRG